MTAHQPQAVPTMFSSMMSCRKVPTKCLPVSTRIYALSVFEREVLGLERSLGRHPSAEEIAAAIGLDPEEYLCLLEELYPVSLFTTDLGDQGKGVGGFLHNALVNGETPSPWVKFVAEFFLQHLAESIETLPETERTILTLQHFQKLGLPQVSYLLHLPQTDVCQMHSQGMIRLRIKMKVAWQSVNATQLY